jgi:hypothetical protein
MKKNTAPMLAAILLLLPVMYVLGYYAIVEPETNILRSPYEENLASIESQLCLPGSVFGPPSCLAMIEKLFWPWEQVDRMFRPQAWEARDEVSELLWNACRSVGS